MAQSALYKRSGVDAEEVTVGDDPGRELGLTTVKEYNGGALPIESDSSRSLGNTQVTNTVSIQGDNLSSSLEYGRTEMDEGDPAALNGGSTLNPDEGKTTLVQALPGNDAAVYVGGSSVTENDGYPLSPGMVLAVGVSNVGNIYVTGQNPDDAVAWVVEN